MSITTLACLLPEKIIGKCCTIHGSTSSEAAIIVEIRFGIFPQVVIKWKNCLFVAKSLLIFSKMHLGPKLLI